MKLYRVKRSRLFLSPHQAQWKILQSHRRFTFFIAGTQGGKTALGPWWLRRAIYGGEGWEPGGPGDYLAVTASYDLFKLKMLPELRTVFEHLLGIGRYWAGDKVLELKDPETSRFWANRQDDPMWARIILRSAQSEGGLESATAKAAWLDEVGQDEFNLGAWEAVLRRLSLAQGYVLGTTTPYNLGWLKTEVYDRWRASDPDYFVVQAESTLNPAFPQAEFERARRTLPDWKFQMFYRGEFSRPAGLIYADFHEDVHLRDPFDIPAEWPRYVGIDFGPLHTALVWVAEDVQRKALYAYRESMEGNLTTREHVERARERAARERVVRWIGGAKSEMQQRWDWGDAGIPLEAPPFVDVEAGIDRVIQALREKRLFIFRTCRGLRDELGTYSRELDDNGQPTEKIRDKGSFHHLDSLRYVISGIEYNPSAVGFML